MKKVAKNEYVQKVHILKNKELTSNKVIIYQTKTGSLELKGNLQEQTVWATLDQIASIFGRDKSVISRHLKNIYSEGELLQNPTVAKNATVQIEGKRHIKRDIEYYNLDVIISVGYRVNSKKATEFRIWATKTLKEHLIKGYTLNKKAILKNYHNFIKSVETIQNLLTKDSLIDPKGILDLVKEFAGTWKKLDSYDKDLFSGASTTKKEVVLTADELLRAIDSLRTDLIKRGEATNIFAFEKDAGSLSGIVGNVMQSLGDKSVYPSIEEKAVHLFYFIIKNHPFVDGNKRSGAFAFIWFLRKCKVHGARSINPVALTTLALFIAQSDPREKQKVVRLVVDLLT